MDFNLTEEQKLIQESAKAFVEQRIEPIARQIDAENVIPQDILDEMGSLGLLGVAQSVEYGGAGAGMLAFVLTLEQLGRGSSGVSLVASVNNLGMMAISQFGKQAQKQRWLPDCCSGKHLASFAFTEAATGSDPRSIETFVVKKGDQYVLNGTKRFISLADMKGPIVLFAKDEEVRGVTAFIVEKLSFGYKVDEIWEKVGDHGANVCDISFNEMAIPEDQLLGERGNAFPILLRTIGYGKTAISAKTLGLAQDALDLAVKYAKERQHRGEAITKFDSMQLRLAEMAMKVEAMRWLTYRQGFLAEINDKSFIANAALTKEFVSSNCMDVVQMAIDAHGAYGVTNDYKIELLYRDAIISRIVEGTTDLQRKIIARSLLRAH